MDSRCHLPPNCMVVAITVFFLLCIAFYAFLSPFLGKDLYQYIAIGVYSFLALSVLILYIRCTAIDPANPGILITVNGALIYKSEANIDTQEEAGKSRLRTNEETQKHKSCLGAGCFCCTIFMKEECRKEDEAYQQEDYGAIHACPSRLGIAARRSVATATRKRK